MQKLIFRLDLYLTLVFGLILMVFKLPSYSFLLALPILIISYYRIIFKRDLAVVLILMLSSRLIMGPFIAHSNLSFNVLNMACNYLPVMFILIFNLISLKTISIKKLSTLKWTILLVLFMLSYSLFNISFAVSVFAKEILPLLLFLLVILSNGEKDINYEYLLKFFRYSFLACLLIYLSPDFYNQMYHLFANGIIFKEATPEIALKVKGAIPRNTGFVFDFRILGQLSCLYLILLYYLGKKNSFWDVILLSTVAILTFSRGPILILVFLLIGIYAPKKIKITKRFLFLISTVFILFLVGIVYILRDSDMKEFTKSFNPFAQKNAISQRGMFIDYAMNKFYENPFGNGIGSLSSPNADVKIFAGYTNTHKKVPDKVFYYKVGDAYLALSLAEKGIIGFILLLLSFIEIFFANRNRVSLFFLIGLFINLIGTDIPKQGFYYFVFIVIYYGLSQSNFGKLRPSVS